MSETIRPTKKQAEILRFVEAFINEKGYSPSYREIMSGLKYTSVATVSLHVNSLIKRGHLRKRDRSARSIEIVRKSDAGSVKTNQVTPAQEKWLVDKIKYFFDKVEQASQPSPAEVDELVVLVGALKVLGMEGAAQSFMARLNKLRSAAKS